MTNRNGGDPYSDDNLRAEYVRLCQVRDEREDRIKPIRAKLAGAADEAEHYRVAAMKVAEELQAARGPDWFELKKRIGVLARLLGGY
jgi:hypothetical protein